MPEHKQIKINSPYGNIRIDKGMKEILTLFWKNGFITDNSCQDNFGNIWIAMTLCSYKELMKLSYIHNQNVNGEGWKHHTLYEFLEIETQMEIGFGDDEILDWSDDGNEVFVNKYRYKKFLKEENIEDYFGVSMIFDKSEKKNFIILFKKCFN